MLQAAHSMVQSKVSGSAVSGVFILTISDAVMGTLTRGQLCSAPTRAISWRRVFICGVWGNGNVSNGLLRIQKNLRSAR